jgi:hypothetical protein
VNDLGLLGHGRDRHGGNRSSDERSLAGKGERVESELGGIGLHDRFSRLCRIGVRFFVRRRSGVTGQAKYSMSGAWCQEI